MALASGLEGWTRLRDWLQAHAPEALDRLHRPADPEALAATERVLGVPFPPAYRAWMALHDGAEHGILDDDIATLEELVSTWRMRGRLLADGTFADAGVEAGRGVRPVWWHPRWIPITNDGAGNSLCLDLDPGPEGTPGQIVRFWHDHPRREVVADSFDDLFDRVLDDLRSGRRVVVEDRGAFDGLMLRNELTGSLATLRIRGEDDAAYRARVRDDAQRSPGHVAISLAPILRRYRLLDHDASVQSWELAMRSGDAANTVSSLNDLAPALHAALSAIDGVALSVSVQRLDAIVRAFPFVEEILGPPPPRPPPPPPPDEDLALDPNADPIEVLLDYLTTAGKPPLAWTVRHASDGSLEPLWNACPRPRPLLALAALVTDRAMLVRAMCAALRALRSNDELRVHPGLLDSLEIAERWSRGEIDDTEASALFDARTSMLHGGSGKYLRMVIEAKDAVRAATNVSNAIDFVAEDEAAQRAGAEVVRRHIPCPTLAQLMEAYSAG